MKSKDYTIIVTSKDEVIALIAFFRSNSLEKYRIINLDEEYLNCFPKDDISKEFLEAYRSSNDAKMRKVCKKF